MTAPLKKTGPVVRIGNTDADVAEDCMVHLKIDGVFQGATPYSTFEFQADDQIQFTSSVKGFTAAFKMAMVVTEVVVYRTT